MSEAQNAKVYWASHHFQSPRIPPREEQWYRYALAEYILSLSPKSILEFGCNSGRNLQIIRSMATKPVELTGIDYNAQSLEAAQSLNGSGEIRYIEGDELALAGFLPNRFDVVFTCSVLDHIPDPEWKHAYDELVRIANTAVVLVEPIIYVAKIEGTLNPKPMEVDMSEFDPPIAAPPYSYSHAYLSHDPGLEIVRNLPMGEASAPGWEEFGHLYHLLIRKK